jgi:hypothetical protein
MQKPSNAGNPSYSHLLPPQDKKYNGANVQSRTGQDPEAGLMIRNRPFEKTRVYLRAGNQIFTMKQAFVFYLVFVVSSFAKAQVAVGQNGPMINTGAMSLVHPVAADSTPFATLYFYKSYTPYFHGSAKNATIHVDDSLLCTLKANSVYVYKSYREGPAKIWLRKMNKPSVKLSLVFGKEYYIKCRTALGLWFGRPIVHLVSDRQGKEELDILAKKTANK